jgi:peptidoglycan hydrolase-like protein with peptidoglycan-binding domain
VSGSVELRPRPTDGGTAGNGAPPSPPRRRRRAAWAVIGLAAAVGVGIAAWLLVDVGDGEAEGAGAVATATAEVARRDLASTETFTGTLGYDDERAVVAAGLGTITKVAPEGAIRSSGQVLYRVDQLPVVLLRGDLPAWRRLESGVEGRDVLQLERSLKALGYDPGTVDREFDSDTQDAVESWQADLGMEETGAVEASDVVFAPTNVRIAVQVAAVGQSVQPGAEVLQISSTVKVVTVELDVSEQSLIAEGDEVTVELPDETQVDGVVARIGTVAEATTDEQTGEETSPTVEVTIELTGEASTNLDQAPVDVSVITDSKEDALAVPVTALLALLGGGYAVEVPDGASTRLVPVEPGMYADGYVEIAEGELAEGDTVVVPR